MQIVNVRVILKLSGCRELTITILLMVKFIFKFYAQVKDAKYHNI